MQNNCKSGTQDQDPTQQMVFESRFSCVLLVSCMHGSDARTRTHTQGQQLRLLFFHLQCPSLPVCLVCCIPRVPNNLGSFSIFCIPHLFVSASFTTQTGSELTKRMQKRTIRSSIPREVKPLQEEVLKEQHAKELQSRNPETRSNSTNGICSMGKRLGPDDFPHLPISRNYL